MSGLGYAKPNTGNDKSIYKHRPPEQKEGLHELIQPLVDAGVVYNKPIQAASTFNGRPSGSRIGSSLQTDAWYETGRIVGIEKKYHIPALPMIRQRQYYEISGNVNLHHTVTNLAGKYSELKKALMNFRYNQTITKSFQGTSGQRGFLKFSLAGQVPGLSKLIAVNPACP